MSSSQVSAAAAPVRVSVPVRFRARVRDVVCHPAAVFGALSILFGTVVIALTPPLRGPDEAAHFLRAYGIARGEFIPSATDQQGRKGIALPPQLYRDFRYFEAAYAKERTQFGNGELIDEYWRSRGPATRSDRPTGFVLYEGSESYTLAGYLPYIAGAFVAKLGGLTFATTLYLMRFAGLALVTAMLAYAVALTPHFRWAFVAIAMLPAALYGRAVISADGMTLATAMVVTALSLRAAVRSRGLGRLDTSLWMALCVLSKPTNLALVVLPFMRRPADLPKLAWIILPSLAAAILWLAATSGDVAPWRMVDLTGLPAQNFDPRHKLTVLLTDPLQFLSAARGTLSNSVELWKQLIGVLGLFDLALQFWAYPAISVLVLGSFFARTNVDEGLRRRIALTAGVAALAYGLAILLICYLAWTPIGAWEVWGVQGRYFIPALPLAALMLTCVTSRKPPEKITAALAIAAAIFSGCASIEAILRDPMR